MIKTENGLFLQQLAHVMGKNIFKTFSALENSNKIFWDGEVSVGGFQLKILPEYQTNCYSGRHHNTNDVVERVGVGFIINAYFSGF